MKITLTGASGFLGTKLIEKLMAEEHQLHVLGRRKPAGLTGWARFSEWDAMSGDVPVEAVNGADVVLHLAGEPVAQKWNEQIKHRIRESRVKGTNALVAAIAQASVKPKVLVAASAIGFYGSRGDEVLTESSAPGSGFLPEVCVAWEKAIDEASAHVQRIVKLRIGIVLGAGGGAIEKMLPPFKMGVGGRLGDGRMWMSWIHIDDMVGLLHFALHNEELAGAVNATSPNPVRNEDFTRSLGRALQRPTLFAVPVFALKAMYGEMASVVLASQRVEPEVVRQAGYNFQYADLDAALRSIV
ncbi:MAG: TIGR01777 family oxidoreductase [Bryobacterales bacterium]|nr:TIGR01777 family oxidoreductase [Bryobacterales bacterium]